MGKKSKNRFRPISVKEEKIMESNTEMEKDLNVNANVNVEPEVITEAQNISQEGEGVTDNVNVVYDAPAIPEENSEEPIENPIPTVTEEIDSTDETTEESVKVTGKLVDCAKLNIRAEASKDSDVVTILTDEDIISIDLDESTEEFYKVNFNEFSGYCVKKFIQEITE